MGNRDTTGNVAKRASNRGADASGNIIKCEDGKYRWVYELSLWRNPAILVTVLKVFAIAVAVETAFMLLLLVPDFAEGALYSWQIEDAFQTIAIMSAILVGLTLIGYAVYAIMMGGSYCVSFEMDESGIEHKQLPRQFKKAQAVAALNVLAGVAAGSPTQMGMGVLTASRNSLTSDFEAVKSIKGSRALQVIKVNEPLAKNQVYTAPEDYDFVFNYIVDHCPHAASVKG